MFYMAYTETEMSMYLYRSKEAYIHTYVYESRRDRNK